ncbi:hypothetical protein NLI96_g656 [Meripilus lineatus]|uniref:Nitrogen regulatory protein areA GATA-like domain-containing protein n=1 Tax=Meripilus lineatus TaxID=2056292 RepID=A0AAD5VCC8_9APHY|nr:hypothetical protein NLI96_g656 [Physisporinus lineatus]
MIDFPSPILSVASDVVKELDGQDALRGMWTVFTKCKSNLKDGRRLENLSWRLWSQEMAAGFSQHPQRSRSPPPSESSSAVRPITPISDDSTVESHGTIPPRLPSDITHRFSPPLDDSALDSPVLSAHGLPSRSAASRRLSTGTFILGFLPDKLVVPPPTSHPAAKSTSPGTDSSVPTLTNNSPHNLVHPRPVLALPTMRLPDPPATLGFPRVVIVNPTPHPTPPATPHPPQAALDLPSGPAPAFLLPPQPLGRPLFYTHNSSSSSSSSSSARSKPETPEIPSNQDELVQPPSPDVPPSDHNDATLKPSDRRRFLKNSGSPERHSPDVAPSSHEEQSAGKGSIPEPSPSSGTSSHIKSDGVRNQTSTRRPLGKGVGRRKEIVRHAPSRTTASRVVTQRQLAQRKNAHSESKKAAFKIGSASTNGASKGVAAPAKAPVDQRDQPVPRPRPATPPKPVTAPPQSKVRVPSTVGNTAGPSTAATQQNDSEGVESEYETEYSDDSEWASEDNSVDEKEDALRQKEAARLKQAAEEAQRQREMFVKVPKRSYSNLNRTQSGLLSQLLNPNPAAFPPNHPYRDALVRAQSQVLAPPVEQAPEPESVAPPPETDIPEIPPHLPRGPSLSGYRPRGRPQGQEMEDDSDSENPENAIPLSWTVAQKKLDALADANRRRKAGLQGQLTQVPILPAPIRAPTQAPAPIQAPAPVQAPAPIHAPVPAPLPAPAPQDESSKVSPRPASVPPAGQQGQSSSLPSEPAPGSSTATHGRDPRRLVPKLRGQSSWHPAPVSPTVSEGHSSQLLNDLPPCPPTGRPGLTSIATAPDILNYPYNLPAPTRPTDSSTTKRVMLAAELPEGLRRNMLWERFISRKRQPFPDPNRPREQLNPQQEKERLRAALVRNRTWADEYHVSGW